MKVERINKATVTYSWSEFFAFLEKHGAFLKFMKALEQHKRANSDSEKPVSEWMETCPPKSWISSAFLWSRTPEGHDYWNVLDAYWKAEVREAENQVRDIENVEWVLLK